MKFRKMFGLSAGVCGILGGIGIIIGSVAEQDFPKPLWIVTAVLCLIGAAGSVINCINLKKKG